MSSKQSPVTDGATGETGVDRESYQQVLEAARAAHGLVEDLNAALQEALVAVSALEAQVERLEAELAALRATKVFRYTSGLRQIYAARFAGRARGG